MSQTTKLRRKDKRATARDRSVARQVSRAFARSRLDTVGLQFVVRDGTVTVHGAVGFAHERRDILQVLKSVRQIDHVIDHIRIVIPQRQAIPPINVPDSPADA